MKNNTLFNPDNWLWRPFGRVADFLILSGLWLVCSVPVVTAGAAFAAMYDCCARCLIGGEREMISRFFRTFRRELPQGVGGALLWAGILLVLVTAVRSFTGAADPTRQNLALAYAMGMLLVFVLGIASWVFPLQSRFTFGFGGLQFTALRLAIAHLPRTVLLGILNLIAAALCLRFLMPVMVVPGLAAQLSARLLEPVFKKYETGDAGENNG